MILFILLFVVDGVVVVYSFFNSFYCSCSGFSMYFTFFRLSVLCCLCCHCVLEPYNPFSIITLYLFLLLFKFLTHYLFVFNSFHCSCTGFSMYFTFLPVGGTLLFMLSLCIEALLSVCNRCFVSVSVLI